MDDLISREDAINAIYHHFPQMTMRECADVLHEVPSAEVTLCHLGSPCEYQNADMALPSAQPDNQTNLCDSCDYSYPDCPSKKDDVIFGNGIGNDNICACNKYKPSAQQWIPCSAKMPEEREWIGTKRFGTTLSDEVYVTFKSPNGERFTKHLAFQNGQLNGLKQQEIDAFHKGSVPIAWMPLPEPWKGEEE